MGGERERVLERESEDAAAVNSIILERERESTVACSVEIRLGSKMFTQKKSDQNEAFWTKNPRNGVVLCRRPYLQF